jgi:hypothetical protein
MDNEQGRMSDARLALDRAHDAARSANGSSLRRSINEAVTYLDGQAPESVSLLKKALDDLDSGALMELDQLLEQVRRQLAVPG